MIIFLTLIPDEDDKILFEGMYKEYKYSMLYICRDILKEQYLAEDALQESFLYVAKNMKHFKNLTAKKLKNLLFTTAKSRAIDILRKRKGEVLINQDMQFDYATYDLCNQVIEDETVRGIMEAIVSLPTQSREVLELHIGYEMSIREMAGLLSLKYDTVRKRLGTAKKRLLYEMKKRGLYE